MKILDTLVVQKAFHFIKECKFYFDFKLKKYKVVLQMFANITVNQQQVQNILNVFAKHHGMDDGVKDWLVGEWLKKVLIFKIFIQKKLIQNMNDVGEIAMIIVNVLMDLKVQIVIK